MTRLGNGATQERPVDEQVHLANPPETECPECDGDGDVIVTCPCCGGKKTVLIEQDDKGKA